MTALDADPDRRAVSAEGHDRHRREPRLDEPQLHAGPSRRSRGSRPARGARPVHDRDGRPGRLRAAGRLVPGAHRAARPREASDGDADLPGRSPGRRCRTSTSSGATSRAAWASAAYFPWEDETALNRWLLEPTGITLEQLEAHPEGCRVRPAAGRDTEEPAVRHAVRQGRVRLGVPGGARATTSSRVPQPGLPRGAGPGVPVRAHHRRPQAPLRAQPFAQHPALRRRGAGAGPGDASGRRRGSGRSPTATRCA